MNRGVMVTRGDPDEDELELSARYELLYKIVNFLVYLFCSFQRNMF